MLSIVVCVLDMERKLIQSLKTLIQSEPEAEIIIVDGHSSDDTLIVAKVFAEVCPRIRIVALPENRGLLYSRIAGFRAGSGDYVAFMDADDAVSRHYYSRMVQVMEREGTDVCIAPAERCMVMMTPPAPPSDGNALEWYLDNSSDLSLTYIWNKAFRRKCLEPLARTDIPYLVHLEDTVLNSAVFSHADGVSVTDDGLYLQPVCSFTNLPSDPDGAYRLAESVMSGYMGKDEIGTILERRRAMETGKGKSL